MHQINNVIPMINQQGYFGPALLAEDEAQGQVKVSWEQNGRNNLSYAKVAVARDLTLKADMQVLLAGNAESDLFVIGVIGNESPHQIKENQASVLQTSQGACARLYKNGDCESIQIFSKQNELVFEYDPETKNSKLSIPQGDLELNTPQGDIKLNAAKQVHLQASSISLAAQCLNIKALVGELLFARMQTTSETLVEHFGNVYKTVKELTQLRTGRMRTLVDKTYQLNANKVLTKSENDFKVKADKIHLG